MSEPLSLKFVRSLPGPDLLNLVFGLSAGVSINLLTAVGSGGVAVEAIGRMTISGWSLLAGTFAVGALSVIMQRLRTEALDGVGPTLSAGERRAEVLEYLAGAAARLSALTVIAVIAFGVGLSVLVA